MTPRLITIPFSHYCEKARWALDHCNVTFTEDGHLPLFHYLATYPAARTRTVPILVTATGVLTDSTDIVAWADAQRPHALIPDDPAAHFTALALEDDFDRQLGPAARRWAYHHLLPMRGVDDYVTANCPRWEARALTLTRPLAVAALRRGLRITPAGVARSRAKVDATFARVASLLATGQRYLAGDTFTVADLTFASLSAPVLIPERYPIRLPSLELFAPEARAQIETWRATPAGQFALELYATQRSMPS